MRATCSNARPRGVSSRVDGVATSEVVVYGRGPLTRRLAMLGARGAAPSAAVNRDTPRKDLHDRHHGPRIRWGFPSHARSRRSPTVSPLIH